MLELASACVNTRGLFAYVAFSFFPVSVSDGLCMGRVHISTVAQNISYLQHIHIHIVSLLLNRKACLTCHDCDDLNNTWGLGVWWLLPSCF